MDSGRVGQIDGGSIKHTIDFWSPVESARMHTAALMFSAQPWTEHFIFLSLISAANGS